MEKLINENEITVKDRIEFRKKQLIRQYNEGINNYSQSVNQFYGFLVALNDFNIITFEELQKNHADFIEKIL